MTKIFLKTSFIFVKRVETFLWTNLQLCVFATTFFRTPQQLLTVTSVAKVLMWDLSFSASKLSKIESQFCHLKILQKFSWEVEKLFEQKLSAFWEHAKIECWFFLRVLELLMSSEVSWLVSRWIQWIHNVQNQGADCFFCQTAIKYVVYFIRSV